MINELSKYLLITYYVPKSILGMGGTAMDKGNKVLAFVVYNLVREGRESTSKYI